MIEAEGEDGWMRADRDGVVAVLIGDDRRLLEEAADAEDGRLRLIDDRRAELLAEDAGVGECEGAAEATSSGLSFLERARSARSTMARGDAEEALVLGLA